MVKLIVILMLYIFVISGCATTPNFNDSPPQSHSAQGELLDTSHAIPSRTYSEKQKQWSTYKGAPNPYLAHNRTLAPQIREKLTRAQAFLKTNQPKQATVLLEEVIETQPRLSGPWVRLGDI